MDRFILTDAQWAKMEPLCLGTPGDPGADRNHQNVDQVMLDFALAARILNNTEMPNQAFDGHDPLLAGERARHHSSGSGQRQKFHAFALPCHPPQAPNPRIESPYSPCRYSP